MPTRDKLFLAYRQAKAALFFERRGIGLFELAQFERDLTERLDALASRLSENGGWFDGLPNPNYSQKRVVSLPKSLYYIMVR